MKALLTSRLAWRFNPCAIARFWLPTLVVLGMLFLGACTGGSESTPTPTATASPTSTAPLPTPTPTASDTSESTSGEERVAQDGDNVEVHYRGTLDNGEEFDSSAGREPLAFTVGAGQVIKGFDDAVRGLKVGDKVTVRIEPEEAYGLHQEELVIEVPRSQAPSDLEVGSKVALSNGRPATVVEITDDTVKIDANPPLAGEALTFEIELVAIK